MTKGKIYLIPSTLGESDPKSVLPEKVFEITNKLEHYLVENERTAKRFLITLGLKHKLDVIHFYILNKNSSEAEFSEYLSLTNEFDIGLLSEAGMPCIADPGSGFVQLAHKKNISVIPITGPTSILLALMASGLNGQNFAFNGYLPIQRNERIGKISFLEAKSKKEKQAQIFMETPYRNDQLFKDIISTCNTNTSLCIASNISLSDEYIKTKPISGWKNNTPEINKKPTIFIIQSF